MPSLPGVLKVYGGWINLDDKPQFFSCVLGSHCPGDTSNGGFVPVSDEEALEIKTRKLSTKIEIPPGGILIFQGGDRSSCPATLNSNPRSKMGLYV